MTIEEARATYRRLLDEIGCYDAIRNRPEFYDIVSVAIVHLMKPPQNPWVRTSGRLPTEADAGSIGLVMVHTGNNVGFNDHYDVLRHPSYFAYWMPIPPLPEVTA